MTSIDTGALQETVDTLTAYVGISGIEKLATDQEKMILDQKLHQNKHFDHSLLSDEKKVEILVRVMVQSKFRKALAGKVEPGLLGKLQRVMFEVAFPAPPVMKPEHRDKKGLS